jgi:hypothetical protein
MIDTFALVKPHIADILLRTVCSDTDFSKIVRDDLTDQLTNIIELGSIGFISVDQHIGELITIKMRSSDVTIHFYPRDTTSTTITNSMKKMRSEIQAQNGELMRLLIDVEQRKLKLKTLKTNLQGLVSLQESFLEMLM